MDRNSQMEIKQSILVASIVIILSIFFQACKSQIKEQVPTSENILGTWKSSENAEVIFDKNGTFTGSLIPAEFGFFPADSFKNVKFSGSGKWTLRKGNTNWEIYLDFDKVNINKGGCAFPLLISGESGILENKSPWYLFIWKEEEGGERYKFLKQ